MSLSEIRMSLLGWREIFPLPEAMPVLQADEPRARVLFRQCVPCQVLWRGERDSACWCCGATGTDRLTDRIRRREEIELARPNWEFIRVDVLIMEHPKIEGLSDKAFRALIDLWCYCGRGRNDGIVTEKRWKQVPARIRAELVAQALADPIDIGGGVVMHDFTGPNGHQRTRKEIEEAAEARAEKARHAANSRWSKPRTALGGPMLRACQ